MPKKKKEKKSCQGFRCIFFLNSFIAHELLDGRQPKQIPLIYGIQLPDPQKNYCQFNFQIKERFNPRQTIGEETRHSLQQISSVPIPNGLKESYFVVKVKTSVKFIKSVMSCAYFYYPGK